MEEGKEKDIKFLVSMERLDRKIIAKKEKTTLFAFVSIYDNHHSQQMALITFEIVINMTSIRASYPLCMKENALWDV